MTPPKAIEQVHKLRIHDDTVHIRVVENVLDILRFQPIVNRHVDRRCASNAKDTLQKGGGVGAEDADASVAFLLEVVGEAARAASGFGVGVREDFAVGGAVVDGAGVGFDGGGAREPVGGRELVDVVAVFVFARAGGEVAGEGGEAVEGGRHGGWWVR